MSLSAWRRSAPKPEYYERLGLLFAELRKLNRKGKGAGIA